MATSRTRGLMIGAIVVVVGLVVLGTLIGLFMLRGAAAPSTSAPPVAESAGRGAPPPPDETAAKDAADGRAPLVVTEAGARRVSCPAACALEADCGLRTREACLASSCDPATDNRVRVMNRSDFCVAEAATCADAVVCTCEEACWRRGECAGDHADDARCTSSCAKLARQTPAPTYVENRCVLESACADIAVCSSVTK